jgi:uncharacterized membrane protein YphA (DoxX/SURF4 family)
MTDAITHDRQPTGWKNYALWGVQGLLALAFLAAGGQKLLGTEAMVALFAEIGAGQWFRVVTGLVEVTAAVLILVPRTVPIGAGLIIATMIGAVYTHLALIGGSPVPALVLLVLAGIVFWGRRAGA